jgi:hypothetical protein
VSQDFLTLVFPSKTRPGPLILAQNIAEYGFDFGEIFLLKVDSVMWHSKSWDGQIDVVFVYGADVGSKLFTLNKSLKHDGTVQALGNLYINDLFS